MLPVVVRVPTEMPGESLAVPPTVIAPSTVPSPASVWRPGTT